jgi:hypothetical protein
MKWAADDDTTFRSITSDTVFLTKSSIYVTYPAFNPLSVRATAKGSAADDPTFATITKLISALTSVAQTISPALPANTPAPVLAPLPGATCVSASKDIEELRKALYPDHPSAADLKQEVADWIASIDNSFGAGKSGPASIAVAIAKINTDSALFPDPAAAKNRWNVLLSCASSAADPERGYYQAAALSNQLPRLQQLADMKDAADKLASLLGKDYKDKSRWMGTNETHYIISNELLPTFEKMQTVNASVSSLTISVDSVTGAITSQQQDLGSASFSVRKYSPLTPEIGIGAVFGTLIQPTYGTSTNSAGNVVVAKKNSNTLSVNPTILANFVCRCGSGSLVPMVQIGAATSKDLPSILLGGGFRLFGLSKGDVAVGGGLLLGWYKDLKTLHVGDVISGTNDINNDLAYISTPKPAGYFAVQYKF